MCKKEAIVFGRGQYYLFKKETINKNYNVIGFLDNNPNAEFGAELKEGVEIKEPTEVNCFPKDVPILVMSSRKSFIIMTKQLLELGVSSSRIILGINLEPCFDKSEKLIRQLDCTVSCNGDGFELVENGKLYTFNDQSSFASIIRHLVERNDLIIQTLKKMPDEPISRSFGREIGEPIDRFYIERFLTEYRNDIKGHVMEVADDTYTRMFGENVIKSSVLHINGWNNTIKGDLETGVGIEDNMVDCLICTQTIQMIYKIVNAMKNIYRLLKQGGVALITIHGISQISLGDYNNWGEYWRVTKKTALLIAKDAGFLDRNIEICSYGNVKTTMCFLYGMSQEQLDKRDFEYCDNQYPLIIGIRVKK